MTSVRISAERPCRTAAASVGRVLAVVAVAVTALCSTPVPAGAAAQQLELISTGATLTTAIPGPLAGGGLIGAWDEESGAFSGETLPFDPIVVAAIPPVIPSDIVVSLKASDESNLAGTIDAATGSAQLTAAMTLSIYIPAIDTTCTTAAFDVAFTTDAPGQQMTAVPFGDSLGKWSMTLEGTMTVPAFDLETGCVPVFSVAAMLNGPLGLPAEWRLSLPLEGASAFALSSGESAPLSAPPTTSATPANVVAEKPTAVRPRLAG